MRGSGWHQAYENVSASNAPTYGASDGVPYRLEPRGTSSRIAS